MKRSVNPLLPLDEFIPDVEARVFAGSDGKKRLFLYGSHDEYQQGTWCSHQYHVYSAPLTDLSDWTDHGVSFASRKGEGYMWDGKEEDGVSWTDAILYAPDVIDKDGKYWLASCFSGGGLGMSVSDNPEGPFSPATQIIYEDGEPLGSIDPTLYEENDTMYMIWGQRQSFGGEGLVGVELRQDAEGMYAIADRSTKHYLFGDAENPDQGFGFYEGPSIRKIRDKYYLLYPSDKGKGVHMMSYATAEHPLDPYTFRGNILDNDGCDLESGNNHGSLCEVNGQWYIFYHRGFGNSNMRRKVCVEPIFIDEEGNIGQVDMTNNGFGDPLSPYDRIEAAYATHVRLDGFRPGCYLEESEKDLHPLVHITNGNCVEYKDFDFGMQKGKLSVIMEICPMAGGNIKILLDTPKGEEVGIVPIESGSGKEWIAVRKDLKDIVGVHTIYLQFESKTEEYICELATFHFEKEIG